MPDAFGLLSRLQRQYAFAVFDVLEELAKISRSIRIDLLAVLVAHAILKVTNEFGSFMVEVATVPPNSTVNELTCVLVAVVKVHDAFASHEALLEVTLIHTRVIVQSALSMEKTITELSRILKLFVAPCMGALAAV